MGRQKSKVMRTCPICGKRMLSQGLGGHLKIVHGVRSSWRTEAEHLRDEITRFTKDIREALRDLERKINVIEERLDREGMQFIK